MLTDIFADRYDKLVLWKKYEEAQRKLIVQTFRLIEESVAPYWIDGKESENGKAFWKSLNDRLSMELGLKSLSDLAYSYKTVVAGAEHTVTGIWTFNTVCENWMLTEYDGSISADRFIKERVSLVELAFRMKADEIARVNAELPARIKAAENLATTYRAMRLPGDPIDGLRAQNQNVNANLQAAIEELNSRFRQAGEKLNYHNGFIQLSDEALSLREIESPFWNLVAAPLWKNIDTDMKEAIDRRDNGDRDPAFYAARALESTIKIVSDEKGWTHGKERGAHNYIDNLRTNSFLVDWELDALKSFFQRSVIRLVMAPVRTECQL